MPCYDSSIYESQLTQQQYHYKSHENFNVLQSEHKTATSNRDCTIRQINKY